ncbi:MAG: type VI secretion system tube protein Hcp [Alphaproteobacteria bacterium]|nr:type VI secretion system tube protein Hcp [Alphaproteobacteria bacterium]
MAIYMKIPDIPGDTTQGNHKEWIEVQSCQFGVGRGVSTRTGSAQDREASEPNVSEIVVTKLLDKASVKLFQAATQNQEGKKVEIHFCSTAQAGQNYLEIELSETIVSSWNISSGGDRPMESVSLNGTKLNIKYQALDQKDNVAGKPIAGYYDIAAAKGG